MKSLSTFYRPQTFENVLGQSSVIKILKRQLELKSFKNAYLFCGPSGDGKTTLARIFAKEINHGQGSPIEIDGASNNGVDNVRSIIEDSKSRALDADYKVYIVDECFTGDTLITTSDGVKKIKDIVPGDRVMTLTGFNNVTQVHHKKVETSLLNLVKLSDGRIINTTTDHLFLTTKGWIESKNLKKGDILLDAKNMPKLWKDIHNKTQGTEVLLKQVSDGVSKETLCEGFDRENLSYLWETLLCGQTKYKKENLLASMQSKVNIAIREDNGELRIWDGIKETIIYKNDKSKSNEEFTKYREDALNERIEWNSASVERSKRWKWHVYRTSDNALEGIRRFLDNGISNQDKLLRKQSKQICFVIQSRPWLSRDKISNRGGWQISSLEKNYCLRYEKNYMSKSVRVESIEIYQPGDSRESRDGITKDTELFDITVENSPTYFANGVLVHNCHAISNAGWQAFLKCIEEPESAYTIFMFCTTDPQKIPATILNRVIRLNLTRVKTEDIKNRLMFISDKEEYTNYNEACDYIAKLSGGSVRTAISLLEKCAGFSGDLSMENVLTCLGNFSYETFFVLTNSFIDGSQQTAIKVVEDCYNLGFDLKQFIEQYLDFVLDVNKYCIFHNIETTKIPQMFEKSQDTRCLAYICGIENTTVYYNKLVDKILDIKNTLKYDTNQKVTIEIEFINICRGIL